VADSTSGAETQSYSLFQLKTRSDLKNSEVVTLVKRLAHDHHSAALAQLASRITAVLQYGSGDGEDVFGKIKGLIRDMIAKLEKEAQADATEKAYCDEQMAKTEEKQTELEDDVKKLTVKIDEAAAKSAGLKEEIKILQAELAALAKEQSEMDRIRSETHADFAVAQEDLSAGLAGVRKALGVLRDYYGGAAAMLQEDDAQPKVPQHAASTGAGQSIINILEVCESDFAKDLTAEETEEADAQAEYDKQTQENSITKTMKDQDVKYKTQESTNLDKSIAELTGDRANEQTELDAVNEYYAKIKERCIAKPETYEERAKRREAEIAGLKEALSILENETAFTQRRKRGHHLGFLQ
jgi:chromosome segregation ATPase